MTDDDPPDPSAAAYDRELVPWLFAPWAEPLVDLVSVEASSSVVDLACGSGLIVRHLLRRLGPAGRVHGVDIDRAMLAYAATRVGDGRVSWHEAAAERLPFAADSMDRVSCHQGLQFFPDRFTVLEEVRRVLQPGGRLVVATWGRIEDNPWPAALSRAVGSLLGDEAGAGMAGVCELGDAADLAELLREGGFENVTVEPRSRLVTHPDVKAAVAGQLSALPSGSAIDGLTGKQRSALVALMSESLSSHCDAEGRLDITSTCNLAHGVNP